MSDLKRVRYFDHEFLEAADFEVEQEYHRGMRYRHTREFHTWGVASKGLEVSTAENQETGEETKIVIYPGAALDNEGREIVLTESRFLDFDQPCFDGGKSYYITIRWHEQQGLPRQDDQHKRWVEVPQIQAVEQVPERPDLELVLAKVTLRKEIKTIEIIDNSLRWYAAHEVGDKTVKSVKIVEADGVSGQDINRGDGIKTGHIQDGAVTIPKLADSAVITSKITDGAVTESKLGANSVTSSRIRDGNVGAAELANGAVTEPKLGANSVTSSRIRDGNVGTAELANGAVIESKLGVNSVTSSKIRDGNVGTAELANGAVSRDKLGTNSVTNQKIGNGSVSEEKLSAGVREKFSFIEKGVKAYVDNLLVGSVAAFAMSKPPDGWKECNGQALSRSEFSRLFSKIGTTFGAGNGSTTFNVPDLRGEFIRGWDHGRGVDPGRGFKSIQDHQMQDHGHSQESHLHSLRLHMGPLWKEGFLAGKGFAFHDGFYIRSSELITSTGQKIGAPTRADGHIKIGSESRPRNIALMYCIKY